MDTFVKLFANLWDENPGIFLLLAFLSFIGAIGKAKLFAKAGQPWVAAFVPIWDFIVALKIVGRPVSHVAFFLIPFYNVYFAFRVVIEIAQSFGKTSVVDYVLVCLFNIFYLLNLGLAYNEEYFGPVFGKDIKDVQARKPALV